jgi:hypothetical protein
MISKLLQPTKMLPATLLALSITTSTAQGYQLLLTNQDSIMASPADIGSLGGSFFQALSAVESGDDDNARGRDGEVSRYQILKSVWKQYGKGLSYKSEHDSTVVAGKIMRDRIGQFSKVRGRRPTRVELYVLWNKPAHALRGEWSKLTNERAKRFANLMR